MAKLVHSSRLSLASLTCLCLGLSLNACHISSNPREATSTPDPASYILGGLGAPVPTDMYASWGNYCLVVGGMLIDSLTYYSTDVLPDVDPPQILEPAEGGILPFGTVTLSYLTPASPQPTLYDIQTGFFVIDINQKAIVTEFPPAIVSAQPEAIVNEQWMPMYPGGYMLVVSARTFPVVTSFWYPFLKPSNIGGYISYTWVCIIVENTVTITPSPSPTTTPTSSPTATLTLTPSPTATSTKKPIPPTPIPPPPVVSCSDITDPRICEANDACYWGSPPTSGPKGCHDRP